MFTSKVNLDRTQFWSNQVDKSSPSGWTGSSAGSELTAADMDDIVALTKVFVLEWSQELDYQLYHDLPVELLLA